MELPKYMVLSHPEAVGTIYIISTTPPILIGYIVTGDVQNKFVNSPAAIAFNTPGTSEACFLLCQIDTFEFKGSPESIAASLQKILKEMLDFYIHKLKH